MNMKTLSIAILATSVSSAAMATDVATKTGDNLTKVSDSVFSALTGKKAFKKVTHPVSLYDYTQGTSAYEDAYISGNFTARNNANQVDKASGKDMEAGYDLLLDASYEKVFSSADSNTSLSVGADASLSDSGVPKADLQDDWNLKAKATYDQYFTPGSNGAFWFGEGDIAFTQEQGKDYGGFENPKADVTGGVGYGRVVNVTPMATSIRLIEALVERGILASTPSKAVYNKVAMIVSKKSQYQSKYGSANYMQSWVRDIEGALGQNIGASGAIKAYDVLQNESISTRKYGWNARAGVGASLSTFSGVNKKIRPTLKAGANYYYPISLQTQFSNEATFTTVLDDDDNSYQVNNSMGLTYELSDRVDWINSWDLAYNKTGDVDTVTNKLKTTYSYDISNALAFNTSLALAHQSVDGNDSDVDAVLTSGIKYRLK